MKNLYEKNENKNNVNKNENGNKNENYNDSNKRFNNIDIDFSNQEIADKIRNESQSIRTETPNLDDILNNNSNNKKIFRFPKALATAACFVLIISSVLFFNNNSKVTDSVKTFPKLHTSSNYDEVFSALKKQRNYSDVNYMGPLIDSDIFVEEKQFNATDSVTDSNGFTKNSESNNSNNYSRNNSADNSGNSSVKNSADNSGNNSVKNYSSTNVQVKNIDEGDIVKTDGKYIYTATSIKNGDFKNRIIITKANGSKSKIVADFIHNDTNSKNISEIYVYKNRLMVLDYQSSHIYSRFNRYNRNMIYISVYDLSNIKRPKLINSLSQEGNIVSSRLKGNYIYCISYKPNYSEKIDIDCIPKINDKTIAANNIIIPKNIEAKGFTVITSLDITNCGNFKSSFSLLGAADQIYMSNDNLYIFNNFTQRKVISDSKPFFDINSIKRFFKRSQIENENKRIEENLFKTEKIDSDIDVSYRNQTIKFTEALGITKYSYDNGSFNFLAETKINGAANSNMFFDEKDGYLRFVAKKSSRTLEGYKCEYRDGKRLLHSRFIYNSSRNDTPSTSAIVLDSKLKKIASIDGLGKNENIYSARYLGNYGYFVTFRQTDPLFCVDYTDIRHPKLISELKLPGYSSYLHFYGKDTLLGFGMQNQSQSGQRLKLEMYDIKKGSATQIAKTFIGDDSVVANDTLTDDSSIGDGSDDSDDDSSIRDGSIGDGSIGDGSDDTLSNEDSDRRCNYYSDAINNYRELLVDENKNLIGIPYSFLTSDTYHEYTAYALYSFENNTFKLKKEIILNTNEDYYNNDIRGMYIGNYFYIVSRNNGIYYFNLKSNNKISYLPFNFNNE